MTETERRNQFIFADYDRLVAEGYRRDRVISMLYEKYTMELRYNIKPSTIEYIINNRKRLEK